MRRARTAVCVSAAALVVVLAGCGNDRPAEGLISNIDKARNAASVAALQTGLVTAAVVQADSPGQPAESLVPALQAKDPTNRYTTATPTAPGIVQVLGGGGGPVMLVSINSDPSAGREPYYVGAWQDGGSTMYYVGHQPPAYATSTPAGPGWSSSLTQ